ncbi:MAG: hypothetical protein JNL75_01730 [Chitinophagales bacterium]|nr:hypothetical protein [Chitinophagales bacterium]
MFKRILAGLFFIVNLSNAPKAIGNLNKGLASQDYYASGRGFTYFISWLIFFGLIIWLWKSGGKQRESNSE